MNPHKGEVSFDAGGQSYTLRFSVDALCGLETVTGKGIVALLDELMDQSRMSLTMMRQVVWCGLREHHPDITVKDAGELIAKAGGFLKMMEHVSSAIALAFPSEDTKPNPPKPGNPPGTGPASGKRGAR
jgi:hypothetical protein